MREMKDSGIEWLGKIPSDWKITRIGGVYSLRNTKVSDRDFPPLSVTNKGVVPQLESAAKTNAHDDRKLVKKGDFAINSRSDRRGSCGISNYDGSVSLINTILAPNEEMHPKYYDWLFHTVQFGEEFYKWGHGIVDDLWTTNWNDMKRITIPMPCYKEQIIIADFLDKRCNDIDALISDIQKQIDVLKEYKKTIIDKETLKGKQVRFKYIAEIKSNLVSPLIFKQYQQIGPDSIEKGTGKIIIHRTVEEATVDSWNHLFYEGQLIYSKIRPVLNKVAIAPYDGLCSADMYPIETKENTNYIKYAMLSSFFVNQVNMITKDRIKMPKINQNELSNILVNIPERHEQDIIANYLDDVCKEIDINIEKKNLQIEILLNYKKSIVFEYITGKKEVGHNV